MITSRSNNNSIPRPWKCTEIARALVVGQLRPRQAKRAAIVVSARPEIARILAMRKACMILSSPHSINIRPRV